LRDSKSRTFNLFEGGNITTFKRNIKFILKSSTSFVPKSGNPVGPVKFGNPVGPVKFGNPVGPVKFGNPVGPVKFGNPVGPVNH
jgi:hypothetical protein